MDTKSRKRGIIVAFILLVIFLIILVVLVNYINSKQYIFHLLNKGAKKVNYSSQYEECVSYVKDDIEKTVYQNGNIAYYNYSKNELIYIDTENKEITISDLEESSGSYKMKYKNDFETKEYEYKGTKEINGITCFVVDLFNADKENYLLKRIYINKKIGIIERIEYYNMSSIKESLLSRENYNMHTGDVTEEDIAKPDVNEYEGYKIIDQTVE